MRRREVGGWVVGRGASVGKRVAGFPTLHHRPFSLPAGKQAGRQAATLVPWGGREVGGWMAGGSGWRGAKKGAR